MSGNTVLWGRVLFIAKNVPAYCDSIIIIDVWFYVCLVKFWFVSVWRRVYYIYCQECFKFTYYILHYNLHLHVIFIIIFTLKSILQPIPIFNQQCDIFYDLILFVFSTFCLVLYWPIVYSRHWLKASPEYISLPNPTFVVTPFFV